MSIQVSEYVNVKDQALKLGCNSPTGLALLPRNFETAKSKDELVHESAVPDIRIIWRQAGISETKIEKESDKFPYAQENAFEWVGPIIFVSTMLLSQNPHAISIALNIISNFLTDWFKGIPGIKKVKLDVVIEKDENKKSIRIHYDGDPDGLAELDKVIREVRKNA